MNHNSIVHRAQHVYFEIKGRVTLLLKLVARPPNKERKNKIMGYEMPNVCKEIYLPIRTDDSSMSIHEYKKKYGVDLRDIFNLTETGLYLRTNISRSKVFVVCLDTIFGSCDLGIIFAEHFTNSTYVEGSISLVQYIGHRDVSEDEWVGIRIECDKNKELNWDNITINPQVL